MLDVGCCSALCSWLRRPGDKTPLARVLNNRQRRRPNQYSEDEIKENARPPRPSPPYVFSVVGTSRCDVRAACSGATLSNGKCRSNISSRPLLRGRGRRSAPSLPTLNTYGRPCQFGGF